MIAFPIVAQARVKAVFNGLKFGDAKIWGRTILVIFVALSFLIGSKVLFQFFCRWISPVGEIASGKVYKWCVPRAYNPCSDK